MGGGYQISAGGSEAKISVVQSYPASQTSWTIQAVEVAAVPGNWTLTAYAICGVAV